VEVTMTPPEKLVMLYYLAALATLALGFWLGYVVTLRSWITWWSSARELLLEELRRVIQAELEKRR